MNTLTYPMTMRGDRETQLLTRIAGLKEQVERLEDENAELRETFGVAEDPRYILLGFTRDQAKLLTLLVHRDMATRSQLMFALYAHDAELRAERYPKILDVRICQMRKRLKPLGLDITTVWGRGYTMSLESKQRLDGLAAQ